MSEPIDKVLYNKVKKKADEKFQSKTGIYKSSWIVKEYKRLGGKYKGKKSNKKGILRWYKEKWIDLNRPIKNKSGKVIGYKSCGRKSVNSKSKYPLCRPSKRITSKTPKTFKEIGKKSIDLAKKRKAKVKGSFNITFNTKKSIRKYKKKSAKKSIRKYKKKSAKKSIRKYKKSAKKSIRKYKKKSAKKSY